MELEGRIAKETAQHESDTRYCQEMKANLLVEAQKIASDREKLEQDKEAFQEETSKLMQLGLATQQKSAEAAAMREEAVGALPQPIQQTAEQELFYRPSQVA